ncbi:MAG: hypothetical protein IJE68_05145 [Clostridia bacterium]|nr:hypothetical protein [Clostridia bacterium]
MEQFEVVLKTPEGMHYTLSSVENGEQILRLIPNSSEKSKDKATFSQNETVEETGDKAKFFTKITVEDREKVKNWLAKQKGKNDGEKSFLTRVREAIKAVNYDYWIAHMEPSVHKEKVYYEANQDVGVRFSCNQWMQIAKEYAPERDSRLSNLHELFIWYALRIVNGLWTLDYVANDSSSAGNYRNAPGATHSIEKTGARKCGGFCDGQGNSYKIVTREGGYALVGGNFNDNGSNYPVACVSYNYDPYHIQFDSSGVLVLLK